MSHQHTKRPEEGKWRTGFWACPGMGLACGACFCPCFVYGKISTRYKAFPTPVEDASSCNTSCCIFALGCNCCLQWLPLMMKRGDMREQYGIEGSCGKDCFASFCCQCNVLMQMDNDLKVRAEEMEKARTQQQTYVQPQGGMQYRPQQQQMASHPQQTQGRVQPQPPMGSHPNHAQMNSHPQHPQMAYKPHHPQGR